MKTIPIFTRLRSWQCRASGFAHRALKPWVNATALLGLLLALGFAVAGCKKSEGHGAANSKACQSAAPEAKAAWDAALAATQTNDYATAFFTLRTLRGQPDLTPAQTEAIDSQSVLVNDRMTTAAGKGDSNALQAIQEIRKASRTQGR